jgi:hypothetical protein
MYSTKSLFVQCDKYKRYGSNKKQTPWLLVRKRNIRIEPPPPVGKIECQLLWIGGCRLVSSADAPTAVNLSFLDRNRCFFFQLAPPLSWRGWVDPVPDPLLRSQVGDAGNRTEDLWVSSQELWPLDHRDGLRCGPAREIKPSVCSPKHVTAIAAF